MRQALIYCRREFTKRDDVPEGYQTPPFPSLHWPPQDADVSLYYISDVWRFTLYWTIIIFGIFHLGAAGVALFMQAGKSTARWKYIWILPFIYAFIAGMEAILAGSIVGAV